MLRTHDNWERLVAATLKRQEIWDLCHAPSISSRSSDYTSASSVPDYLNNISRSSSRFNQNSVDFNSSLEVESAVNFDVNPQSIFVNGKPLDSRELNMLQSCRNPPRKLKPGSYWYDKFAGFWGKQGHKPSQIISTNLDVGDRLKTKASNGNTFVYINDRELTKLELRMLKLAGVRCYPDTHFWMYDDGSYIEEANNMVKGSVWDKAGMKLLCSLFSLPFPPKSSYASGGLSVKEDIVKEHTAKENVVKEHSVKEDVKQGDIKKFLLIGCRESGTSTIFTQDIRNAVTRQ